MGLRPTQGDEKRFRSSNHSPWKRRPLLCHPERSRGICSSFHQPPMLQLEDELSSRPKRSGVEGPAVSLRFSLPNSLSILYGLTEVQP